MMYSLDALFVHNPNSLLKCSSHPFSTLAQPSLMSASTDLQSAMSDSGNNRDGNVSSTPATDLSTSQHIFTDQRNPVELEQNRDGHLVPRRLFANPQAEREQEFVTNSVQRMRSEMETIRRENQDLRRTTELILTLVRG